jgi:hypothetical protein
MLPDTQARVHLHTRPQVNAEVKHQTIANIAYVIRTNSIDERLAELDREWDVERTLQTNFSIVALLGLALSLKNRRWLLLSAAASAFMVQHALQGWCPPLALFRRLGVRSTAEIERERMALRALRERLH